MSTSEWIGAVACILFGLVQLFLSWQQNQIFKRQNEIFVAQAEGSMVVNSSSSKIDRYWPMLAMTMMMVLAWAAVGYDVYDRHALPKPPLTSVRISMQNFMVDGKSPRIDQLKPDTSAGMNLGVTNFGPLPAAEVALFEQIHWFPLMTQSVEDDNWKDFRKTAVPIGPRDLDVGSGSWGTARSQTLTRDDIREIAGHQLYLYVFLYYEYRDGNGQHSTEYCTYLQDIPKVVQPLIGVSSAEGVIWENCHGHYKIR